MSVRVVGSVFCMINMHQKCAPHVRICSGIVSRRYSFLQNPWRERITSSRPRKILSGTPPISVFKIVFVSWHWRPDASRSRFSYCSIRIFSYINHQLSTTNIANRNLKLYKLRPILAIPFTRVNDPSLTPRSLARTRNIDNRFITTNLIATKKVKK